MLITAVDVLFVALGLLGVGWGFARRPRQPGPEAPPASSLLELVLTALALGAAAVGPNILVVALTPGMPSMPLFTRALLIPSLIVVAVVAALGRLKGLERLTNRVWAGIWIGAAATAALDVIRLPGFSFGFMPGNMPRMFGVLILDQMALGPSVGSDIVGYLYHYWVGACFGLAYTLLLGRVKWWAGAAWGLVIELGMMTTAPMVVAMDTGFFGLKEGPGVLVTSLLAHVAFGAVLGLLAESYVRHPGSVLGLLRRRNDLAPV